MIVGEKNIGTPDRIIRILIGFILIVAAVLNMVTAPWSYLVALIGLILIGTGIFRPCLLYSILGFSTMEKDLS